RGVGHVIPVETLLVVTVDTECDKGTKWVPHWPLAFRAVTEGVAERLQPLFERHGISPAYFLSPEVMRDAASADALRRANRAELAPHLHPEMLDPPTARPQEGPGIFQCTRPAAEERRLMVDITRLYEDTFGRRPDSFRAGRFGAGANTLRCLEELGYRNDG